MPYLEIVEIESVTGSHSEEFLRPITFREREFVLKRGVIFDLGGMEVRVGRDPENDLVIPLYYVSRFHFRLYPESDFYVYENVRSRQFPIYNGVMFTGGRRIVADNDTFNAGGVIFRYRKTL